MVVWATLKYVFCTYLLLGRLAVEKKPIRLTRHAVQRALKFDLTPEFIERIVAEGERQCEGKAEVRYVLRTKRGVLIAVCEEYLELIIVITFVRGR